MIASLLTYSFGFSTKPAIVPSEFFLTTPNALGSSTLWVQIMPSSSVFIEKPASNKVSAKATVTLPTRLCLAHHIACAVPRGCSWWYILPFAPRASAIEINSCSTCSPKPPMIKPISSVFSPTTEIISSHNRCTIGFPATSISGLGVVNVCGRNLLPMPAIGMIIFIRLSFFWCGKVIIKCRNQGTFCSSIATNSAFFCNILYNLSYKPNVPQNKSAFGFLQFQKPLLYQIVSNLQGLTII